MTCARHNNYEQKKADISVEMLNDKILSLSNKLEALAATIDRDMKDKWSFITDLQKHYDNEIEKIKETIKG